MVMKKNIKFGLSHDDIFKEMKKYNACYIVVWCDHFAGNNKGYFQTIEKFEKTSVFKWNEVENDRGATSVWITDEDVPAMINERNSILELLRKLDISRIQVDKKVLEEYGCRMNIDGRWSEKNPKYIDAKKHNDFLYLTIKERVAKIDSQIDDFRKKLKETDFVSSSFIEIKN